MSETVKNSSQDLVVLMMPDYREVNPYQDLLAKALNEQNTKTIFSEGYRRVFPIYRQIKAIPNCQVLHLHWLDPYIKGQNIFVRFIYGLKFFLDIFLVKSKKIKLVWTIHNLTSHNTQFPRFEKWLKRRFIRIADHVIVHSQAAKEEVERELLTYKHPNLTVIPHGHYRDIYPKAIAPEVAREKLGLPPSEFIYLSFGILKPYKGIETLCELWESCPEKLKSSNLLIAGKALDKEYGEKLARLTANNSCIELRDKFIPNEEIHLYFSAVNVVVLPFQQILTSGSLLLAMSYGKPIVAPKFPSLLETLGDAVDLLYDFNDEAGLLNALILSRQVDLQAINHTVQTACDELDWSVIAIKTYSIYQS